ncbi:MAG: hypothetical protein JWP35_3182 [Caulobacter sp.]|nr:hypothetical protein [Caulobacter sp.]
MKSFLRAATTPAGFVLLLACLIAGPQSAVSKPKKPPPAPVIEVPAPPPPVVLSGRVIEQASAYRGYMIRAMTISPAFTDGASVARSLRIGASYEPVQFLRGAVAYGAVAAMQDPTFMANVRTFAGDPGQRRAIAAQLRADPAYAGVFKGADSAAGLVMAALGNEGLALFNAGKAVKQSAYDVQHSAWSKADIPGRPARLEDAKVLSRTPLAPEEAETGRLVRAANAGGPMGLTGSPAPPPYTAVVLRSLAVAALAALGEAGDENYELLLPLLSDPASGTCLNMAKLNLFQCLAVAKPHYEDVFCLGQHIMMDTGQCLIRASGAPLPAELLPKPPKVLPVALPVVTKTKGPGKGAPKAAPKGAAKGSTKGAAKGGHH